MIAYSQGQKCPNLISAGGVTAGEGDKMIKKTKADLAEEMLLNDGWTYDHTALTSGYTGAGTVESMQTRKGYMYKRVYTSKLKNASKLHSYQVTWVYRKEVIA